MTSCWVVTDGRAGIENQALGLAEAVARFVPLDLSVKRIELKAPWARLPRFIWGEPFTLLSSGGALLRPPFPDLWIACGRLSTPFTRAVKKISPATFTVQIQNPRAPLHAFDLVVPPLHDRIQGENVFPILGAPHRVTRQRIADDAAKLGPALSRLPAPRVAVLLGGPNRAYAVEAASLQRIAGALLDFAKSGAGLMITPSRRTPPALIARIKRDIQGTDFFLWDGAPVAGLDNPYFGMLGLADHAAVTADSVNMATEAAIAGKPVHVIALDKKPLSSAAKFERFHAELAERGVSRPLTSPLQTWTYAPLDETSRAAAEVIRRAGFSPPSSAPKAG